MAKKTTTTSVRAHIEKPRIKRAGVHAKRKTSNNKKSRNYKKSYKGQGR
jgi:hypothetical protein